MILRRAATNRGFTLVELLLVIVLIAILMALVTLSGFNMVNTTNAQTEARRIIRTVHSLRSAWLAYYAGEQKMMDPPGNVDKLRQYSDRNLTDEETRYGNINVKIPPESRSTYIGFDGKNGEIWSKQAAMTEMIKNSLIAQAADYGLIIDYEDANGSEPNSVYIRIK